MQTTIEKRHSNSADSLQVQNKNLLRLRRRAEQQGIPAFALRLAASRRKLLAESDTTLRYRHD
jgi:hypothetical protein